MVPQNGGSMRENPIKKDDLVNDFGVPPIFGTPQIFVSISAFSATLSRVTFIEAAKYQPVNRDGTRAMFSFREFGQLCDPKKHNIYSDQPVHVYYMYVYIYIWGVPKMRVPQ